MQLKYVFGIILVFLMVTQNASAFLPLQQGTIIINNQYNSSKQGSYNTTQANNANVNTGGFKLNFINSTNSTFHIVNSPLKNQVNITAFSSNGGSSGVSSLNALTGALTIACISGNTTCTTSGGNTITINTAWNIVTTGLAAQIITKQLTLNNLILGGQASGGNNNFIGLNNLNATKVFQGSKQVIDTLTGTGGTSITGSGNSRTITSQAYQNNTGQNLTPGLGIYNGMNGSALKFRGVVCGSGMACSINATSLRINATSTSSSNSTIPDSIVVYPYSTLITDYTTPIAATASSSK